AQEAGLPVHVGHLSALSAHGLAHYLTLGPVEAVHCYLPSRPPAWLARLPFDLRWHAGRVIADPAGVGQPSAGLRRPSATVPAALKLGVERATRLPWPAVVSGPERAALELAAGLTRGGSWDVAYETFEGLGGLRPALVQALLEACPSVVTKRLFLHLAARAGHAWLSRLDLAGVDLGHGKRQVVPGGRLDPTFRVTVPREEDGGGG
ncbi:MAG TPA: type IV toxin-antitoxin system AbiEi family antitoxin domain-containing protein, partial [Deinococcales bacterium]|nr:type IV toxin-antitoxin system AbiEi family antitoxin domain-containing protein [Deinococcales bacterium]